jgi:hypothetical protein
MVLRNSSRPVWLSMLIPDLERQQETEQDGFRPIKPSSTTGGRECVYSATDEVSDSLYTKASSEYTVSCIVFALRWPLFFHLFFAHL